MNSEWLGGEFEHTVDPKGRITLPARYRDHFAEGAVMVLLPNREQCLSVFTQASWKEYDGAHLAPLDTFNNPDDDWTVRQTYRLMSIEEPDKQGRVMLPQMAKDIELSGKVKILGVRDHLEIWNPDHLAAREAGR